MDTTLARTETNPSALRVRSMLARACSRLRGVLTPQGDLVVWAGEVTHHDMARQQGLHGLRLEICADVSVTLLALHERHGLLPKPSALGLPDETLHDDDDLTTYCENLVAEVTPLSGALAAILPKAVSVDADPRADDTAMLDFIRYELRPAAQFAFS